MSIIKDTANNIRNLGNSSVDTTKAKEIWENGIAASFDSIDEYQEKIKRFKTVIETFAGDPNALENATGLAEGQIVKILGYHSISDYGGHEGIVEIEDKGGFQLSNGLFVNPKPIQGGIVFVEWYGAKNNDSESVTNIVQKIINKNYKKIGFGLGSFLVEGIITIKNYDTSIFGLHKDLTTIINNSATSGVFETDNTLDVMYRTEIRDFKIIQKNGGTGDVITLNNPNFCKLENLDITCASGERASASGVVIQRTSETKQGYFTETKRVRVNKQDIGIKYLGSSPGFLNNHWAYNCSFDDNTVYGIYAENTGAIRVIDPHIEINGTGIYLKNTSDFQLLGGYLERQSNYDIYIESGDANYFSRNRFAASGITEQVNGRSIYVGNSRFTRIESNFFLDVYPTYEIEISSDAEDTMILDCVAKDRINGWNNSGIQILDNGTGTTVRKQLETAGGTNMTLYQGMHKFENIVAEQYNFNDSGTIKILSGENNPEGVVVADTGSIFLRTNGGTGFTFYVKEEDDGLATGWYAK